MAKQEYDLKIRIPIDKGYSMEAQLDRFYGNWSTEPIRAYLADNKEEVIPYYIQAFENLEEGIGFSISFDYGRIEFDARIDSDDFDIITFAVEEGNYNKKQYVLKNAYDFLMKCMKELSSKYQLHEWNTRPDDRAGKGAFSYGMKKQPWSEFKKNVPNFINDIKAMIEKQDKLERNVASAGLDQMGFLDEIKNYDEFMESQDQ